MGLDLYHLAPSKKSDLTSEYFTIEAFEDNPIFLKKYSHLIDELEYYDFNFEILIFPDLATKDLVLGNNDEYRKKPILIGDVSDLTTEIKFIIRGKNVKENNPLILNQIDNLLTNKHNREVSYTSVSFANDTSNTQKVIFFRKKGYQRKGMNEQFYQDFINGKNYYDLKTVQKAAQYLNPTWGDSKADLQQNFKKLFIDNFIEGESIFYANW